MAPMYIGPAVNGCGPQYSGSDLATWLIFGWLYCRRSLMVSDLSGLTAPAEEPPLKSGIIRFGCSSQP